MKFFRFLKKRSKGTKFGYVFAKRLRTTLNKFLDNNRSKRFTNTTQIFFDKQSFQKLEKIDMYLDKLTNQFWLKQK